MEEIKDIKIPTYKVYARTDENDLVIKVFSTCFEQPTDTDILIAEGNGDDYVHVQGKYQLFDERYNHRYKIVDGEMVETTDEERQSEYEERQVSIPYTPSKEEILEAKLDYLAMMSDIDLSEVLGDE